MENRGRVVNSLLTVGTVFILVHEGNCMDEGKRWVVEDEVRVCVLLSGCVQTSGRDRLILRP